MKHSVTPMRFVTYLSMIEGSVATEMFRHGYAKVNGKKKDVMKNGAIACGWHVSSILSLFGYIAKAHATIPSTIADMEKSGWVKISRPKKGAVLLWEEKFIRDGANKHLGFYLDTKRAVSNDYKSGTPQFNHPTYGMKNGKPIRKIEAIYWKPGMEKS